ncbi:sensor histidine kinase [Streptomyces sp. NPDC059063]|uniref:sensor histidine kinase n=1 Tax=unclassified Streptomyces TaxID=2593676 RepID=UPI0036B85952
MPCSEAVDPGQRLNHRQLVALDAVAAVLFTAASAPLPPHGSGELPDWLPLLLAAATGLPVAARRMWPVPAFAVVASASLAAELLGAAQTYFAAAAYVLYSVALTSRREPRVSAPRAAALACLGLAVPVFVGVPEGTYDQVGRFVVAAGVLGCGWTVGRATRERRAYAACQARQLAADAVEEERLRIARELHDVVTHSLGLIAVKAAVANHVAHERPEVAGETLRVIERVSRDALTEMRHMLGLLRTQGDEAGVSAVDFSPSPGAEQIAELVERAESAGVEVRLAADPLDGLPEAVGLSVYRLVQESLTNVVRHAAPTRCQVSVGVVDGEVRVTVTDEGPRSGRGVRARVEGGYGLVGMRERVAVYGGSLVAGPRPGGGFEVSARLPVAPDIRWPSRRVHRRAGRTRPLS